MNITERFLSYVKFDTQSNEEAEGCPSTPKQLVFAEYLKNELVSEGLTEVEMDEHGYIYATLPANIDADVPVVGFIAHMDTSPDCSGADIKPRIVSNYDGKDIVLSEGIVSSTEKFPELLNHIGEDIIVTDGHTLLGADDKAGIAEIVQAMVYLKEHPEVKHGKIRVAFNPDEEIGMGAHLFDAAKIHINGCSVHPGYAKGKMINAGRVATELVQMLPQDETPETTEGYEGFFHLTSIQGGCEQADLSFIIRDHNRAKFERRKERIQELVAVINAKYGDGVAKLNMNDQYYNMREKVEPMMYIIDIAKQAMQEAGVTPRVQAIRGGTDGAQLSFKGLPCPNIFAGGINFHGPYEFCPIQSMEKAMMTVVNICKLVAE